MSHQADSPWMDREILYQYAPRSQSLSLVNYRQRLVLNHDESTSLSVSKRFQLSDMKRKRLRRERAVQSQEYKQLSEVKR